ncbi:MAG TPA: hypothetical protein VN044_04465 [Verrucomicrobiae bacterium]|jgi:hypothetical protein|nr:hypothetical protein [Verrucomicrobiae bacterium]
MVCTIIALLIQFTAPPRAASIADAIPEAVSRRVVTSQSSARPTPESTSPAEGASGETTSGISRALPLVPSENIVSPSAIRVLDAPSVKPPRSIGVEQFPSRRSWILLSAAQHSAAAFDAYSTRYAISRGAREDDPFMRPFANSSALYAAIEVGPLLLDYAARRLERSRSRLIRRIWWVPQSVSTAAFLISGEHNFGVSSHR